MPTTPTTVTPPPPRCYCSACGAYELPIDGRCPICDRRIRYGRQAQAVARYAGEEE